ncbi:hypothetical protein IAT40_003139 [Kwoniella sp. CBS 6097]
MSISPIKPRSSSRLTRQTQAENASALALAGPSTSTSTPTRTTRSRPSQAANHESPKSAISSELTDSEYEGEDQSKSSASSPRTVQAGPSRRPARTQTQTESQTPYRDVKGKGKAPAQVGGHVGGGTMAGSSAGAGAGAGTNEAGPSRRVLPARIRRSAGGGEGMREVEEMIVDWLERWGEPTTTPPDDLVIHLTSIPLSFVQPPPKHTLASQPEPPPITLTPTRKKADIQEEAKLGKEEKIEVPSWVMVRGGEDDEEEAREELELTGRGQGRGAGIVSPVKRLRRGGIGDEPDEDTSDAYYMQLHKKYEVFERRQRIREKETLQFERYKMRSRIDLLKNMPKLTWSSVVSTILNRGSIVWAKGEEKIKEKGTDWLKSQLIKEGEVVMKRFDELLPPEQRKPKNQTPTQADSRHSTPSRASPSPSLTPPPIVLPARVAALRDPTTSSAKRKRRSTGTAVDDKDYQSAADSPSKRSEGRTSTPRVVKTYAKRLRSDVSVELDEEGEIVDVTKEKTALVTQTKTIQNSKQSQAPAIAAGASPVAVHRGHSTLIVSATNKVDRPLYPIFNRPIRPAPVLSSPGLASTPSNTVVTSAGTRIVLRNPTSLSSASTPHQAAQVKSVPLPGLSAAGLAEPALAQRVPYLIEAASRREKSLDTSLTTRSLPDPISNGKLALPSREKPRVIRPMPDISNPFGMPVPSVLESKSEFTLMEKEDFWPIIAQREDLAKRQRQTSNRTNGNMRTQSSPSASGPALTVNGIKGSRNQTTSVPAARPSPVSSSSTSVVSGNGRESQVGQEQSQGTRPGTRPVNTLSNDKRHAPDALTAEEVAEIEGVEAAVVL